MRKQDRECLDPAFFFFLFSIAEDLCLARHQGEFPWVFPLNFVRSDNCIYIHCANEGHKLDCIRTNPNVAFTLSADVTIHREKSTTYYKSLCGTGRAAIVEDPAEKGRALDALAARYAALCPTPTPDAALARTGVIRIDIVNLTGKRKLPK